MQRAPKAVVLISGGLDSMIAAQLMLDQGIDVTGLNFYTGFCHSGHTSAIRSKAQNKAKRNDALWVAEILGIPLQIVDVVEPYKKVLLEPRYGYGSNINPCLDCKIFMVGRALEWMKAHDHDFVVTGEVMGQRQNSQLKTKLPIVSKRSGAEDLLLRPLSAKYLPDTKPEREGWVDKTKLLDITGRSRKKQIAFAQKYGWDDYAQPSGGCCVLTDEHYASKLQDLWQSRGAKNYSLDDIILLKVGRHLRPKKHLKLIIARDEGEVNFLKGYRKRFVSMECVNHQSPLMLLDGQVLSDDDIRLAASILARYAKCHDSEVVSVVCTEPDQNQQQLEVKPMLPESIKDTWYV